MASWEEGTGFRIVGTIRRIFISQSGKFAKIRVAANMHPHPAELDLTTFDRSVIGDIREELSQGQRVQFTGKIENEKLTDRQRNDVKVDGYAVWMPALRIKAFEVEGASRKPREAPIEPAPGADDDPFKRSDDPMGGNDPMGGGSDPFGS